MHKNVEVCEWLTGALHNLEASNLDPCYAKMRGVCSSIFLCVTNPPRLAFREPTVVGPTTVSNDELL